MSEAEWGTIFDVYDYECKRALPKAQVATIMRACGRLLLKDQMDTLLKRFPDPMPKANFIEAMNESVSGEPKEKNLLTALQAFDVKEQNDLSRLEIQQMLCTMNEKISKDEFERIMEGLQFSEHDRCSIDDLFKWLTRPLRSLAKGSIKVSGGGGGGGGGAPSGEPDPFAE